VGLLAIVLLTPSARWFLRPGTPEIFAFEVFVLPPVRRQFACLCYALSTRPTYCFNEWFAFAFVLCPMPVFVTGIGLGSIVKFALDTHLFELKRIVWTASVLFGWLGTLLP
jgi:hypothetical protein